MKILMGTENPGKIEGARQAFEKYFNDFEIDGVSVDSEVGVQPLNEAILKGARNRIKNYIASEAGITNSLGEWIDINLAVVENKDGFQSVGTSQGFPVPEKYREEIKQSELRKSNGSNFWWERIE